METYTRHASRQEREEAHGPEHVLIVDVDRGQHDSDRGDQGADVDVEGDSCPRPRQRRLPRHAQLEPDGGEREGGCND